MATTRAVVMALPLLAVALLCSVMSAFAVTVKADGSHLEGGASPTVNFEGELVAVYGTATGLDGNLQGSYTVTRGASAVTLLISAQTKLAIQGSALPVYQLVIGERLLVQGTDDTAMQTVTATKITVVPFPTVDFLGSIIAVGASATGVDGDTQDSYSVTRDNSSVSVVVSASTVLAIQGSALPVTQLVIGDRLQVEGADNTATNTITATKITVFPFPTVNFEGELLAVNPNTSGIEGSTEGSYVVTRANSSVTVVVGPQTVLAHQGNALPVLALGVGDRLQVEGADNTATNTITATKITVLPFPTVNFEGELVAVYGTATGLDGNLQGSYTVTRGASAVTLLISAQTKLAIQGSALPVYQLVIGDRLLVQGGDNTAANTITATKITVVPFPTVNFEGELVTVNGTATDLNGDVQGSYTVTRGDGAVTIVVSASTVLADQGSALVVNALGVGELLQVQGADNTATNTITATKITVLKAALRATGVSGSA